MLCDYVHNRYSCKSAVMTLLKRMMVGVVQLVERQFVALVVAGSSPVAYPIIMRLT